MIEDDIRALTNEIRSLRKAIESQGHLSTLPVSQPPVPIHRPPDDLPTPSLSDSLNDHEAAKMMGLSVAKLRKWRMFREGPPYRKLGRAVRYSRAQIQQWLETQPGLPLEETGELKLSRGRPSLRG